MPKLSAGLLLYRVRDGPRLVRRPAAPGSAALAIATVDVLIAHPGGPFWARKDDGAWSIPKGEYSQSDDPWAAAQREFTEEVGLAPPPGPRVDLGSVKQPGGKIVTVFAVQGDLDVANAHSNTFELEWPRGSGQLRSFPEVDRVDWFPLARARGKLLKGQQGFLDQLAVHLAER
ncbi:NUDIX domain-containing protein [Mycobacterium cookii]|uniref:NUDIX domain-containing protein n=1 Tax=Mycobacterium cookii TaxID=1775 RepID=A0A7I7KXV3_9MYCO|nr:NUDIX domain-containing protein [Mycobacterium cookii]MCV7331612.1 NUDIX domain-containing protein [Mycobacterium cookii]BBX46905.1 NUDIX domain-containing protein [Mycobacterium cookii]